MSAARLLLFGLGLSLAIAVAPPNTAAAPWRSSDYVVLYFQHYNGKVPLPHLREATQRALFNHLVDPENLARITQAREPAEDKVGELRLILATLGSFRAAYNLAVVVGEPLQQELTLVQVYSLAVADALAGLTENPPQLASGSSAWATLVADVIASVGDSGRYTPAQITRLAEAVALHYPSIATALSADDRRRLIAQAQNLGLSEAGASQREAIIRMQRALIAATPLAAPMQQPEQKP